MKILSEMDKMWFLMIIPAYYSVSLLLLLFPNLIWRQFRYRFQTFNHLLDSNKIFCIGHRGGAR